MIERSTETLYVVVRDCDASQPATSPSSGHICIWPQNDLRKSLRYDYESGTTATSSVLAASNPITPKGGMLSLSANGGASGTGHGAETTAACQASAVCF